MCLNVDMNTDDAVHLLQLCVNEVSYKTSEHADYVFACPNGP